MFSDLKKIDTVEIINVTSGVLEIKSLGRKVMRGANLILKRADLESSAVRTEVEALYTDSKAVITINYVKEEVSIPSPTPMKKEVTATVTKVVELEKKPIETTKKKTTTKKRTPRTKKDTKKKKDDK